MNHKDEYVKPEMEIVEIENDNAIFTSVISVVEEITICLDAW